MILAQIVTHIATHNYALNRRVGGGFTGFGVLSVYGLRLLFKGIRDDIYDWIGEKSAPRWSYIAFGIFYQLPLIAYTLFVIHQGYFDPSQP